MYLIIIAHKDVYLALTLPRATNVTFGVIGPADSSPRRRKTIHVPHVQRDNNPSNLTEIEKYSEDNSSLYHVSGTQNTRSNQLHPENTTLPRPGTNTKFGLINYNHSSDQNIDGSPHNTRNVTDGKSQSIPTAEMTPLAAAILHNNTRQVTDDGSQSIPTAEMTPLAADIITILTR